MNNQNLKFEIKEFSAEDYLKLETRVHEKIIKEDYGIDLTWNEVLALRNYIERFNHIGRIHHHFMLDYFGLDSDDLGFVGTYRLEYGNARALWWGSDWVGDEKFRELCRRKVNLWREERELI
jgi:hypothetical protein